MGRTLFEKIWDKHVVESFDDGNDLIYIDRIFLHERTGSIALQNLHDRNIAVRNPKQVFATIDHIVDTIPGRDDETLMPSGKEFIKSLRSSAIRENINFFDLNLSLIHI